MTPKKTDKIILTPEQEQLVRDFWDKIPLAELTQKAFNNPELDGRSEEGRAIKDWLARRNLTAKTAGSPKGNPIVLTDDQKKYIENNAQSTSALSMARTLFNNPKICPLNNEFEAVNDYVKSLGINVQKPVSQLAEAQYVAPKSIARLIPRVNKYVTRDFAEDKVFFNADKLKPEQEKALKALLGYMNVYRFGYEINKFNKEMDREIFESSFIRYAYDKPDLLEEEVDQYISLCSEIVSAAQIDRHIADLDDQYDEFKESDDGEKKKLSLTFVEMIDKARAKKKDAQERIDKGFKTLTATRADRIKKRQQANATILNLVEAWRNEKKRKEMLELAKFEKNKERREVDRIETLDDVSALIAGISKEEGYN